MTLLSICQEVCNEVGIPKPLSVASTTDVQQLQLNSLMKSVQSDVGRRNWPVLHTVGTFPTVIGTADYALPADFSRLIFNTAWDDSDNVIIRGGATPQEWMWETINGAVMGQPMFKITGWPTKFRLVPTPDSVNTVLYIYKSSYFATDSGGTEKAYMTADTDLTKFDENVLKLHLKWRYLRSRGLDYGEEFREAHEAEDQAYAAAWALPVINLGSTQLETITDGSVPESGFGV